MSQLLDDLLRCRAPIAKAKGWRQKAFRDFDGAMCSLGTVRHSLRVKGDWEAEATRQRAVIRALAAVIPAHGPGPAEAVTYFNDNNPHTVVIRDMWDKAIANERAREGVEAIKQNLKPVRELESA